MAMMREDEAARVLDWRVEIKLDLRWRAKIYFTTSAQIPHCELIRQIFIVMGVSHIQRDTIVHIQNGSKLNNLNRQSKTNLTYSKGLIT